MTLKYLRLRLNKINDKLDSNKKIIGSIQRNTDTNLNQIKSDEESLKKITNPETIKAFTV